MALAATALKDMLSISIKSRHDSHSDQFNRIFMVKILLIGSVVTGLSWYTDSLNCIVPGSHEVSGDFVSSTCWIQGVYIYKDLRYRVDEVAYFGIPKDIDQDGYLKNTPEKELCPLHPKSAIPSRRPPKKDPHCLPMEKIYYLQFQYMPFLLAALSIMFYLPYVWFKTVNSDLISLKDHVKADEPEPDQIAKHFFDNSSNPQKNNRLRPILNVMIKILYLIANIVAFLGLNNVLNGDFISYGSKWMAWSSLPNTLAHDYLGDREHPKPGNILLPPFGYCELYSASKDIKTTVVNKHKYVCELSQYVLYQYVFMIVWVVLLVGINVSILGLLKLLFHYLIGVFGSRRRGDNGRILRLLSFRELEYLQYIRTKDIGLYGEVLEKLRVIKLGHDDPSPPPKVNAPSYDDEYKSKPGFDDY